MDLKSMLNDSSTQRHPPRLHTPQSSQDRDVDQTHHYDRQFDHLATPYHPHGGPVSDPKSSANGYFAIQSPQQYHSASTSTPNVGRAQSIYAQSPGTHGLSHTPRDIVPHAHASFAPSPTPSILHPPTPGSVHQTPSSATSTYTAFTGPSTIHPYQSPRDEPSSSNGVAHAQTHRMSPHAQPHPPPATPLGPPVSYPRPSPGVQRPMSQGYENFRRASYGSVGSTQSRDYNHGPTAPPPEPTRRDSVQRSYSGEEVAPGERERSVESVSPKTIPKPTPPSHPHPHASAVGHYPAPAADAYHSPQPVAGHGLPRPAHGTPDRLVDIHHHETTSRSSSATAVESKGIPPFTSSRPSPGPSATRDITPQSTHSSVPAQPSPPTNSQPNLKRHASLISDPARSPMPPRKRLRRDEVPVFAQSARPRRPLRFINDLPIVQPARRETTVKREATVKREVSEAPAATNGQAVVQAAPPKTEPHWEPSILNLTPYEDLTRRVCDWIYQVIGMASPPAGGAVFEIEAKIGAIFDIENGERVTLPVETEAVFNKDRWRRTKFESSMDMAQHKQLNTFLNELVKESLQEAQTSNREIIRYDHSHECDEFFELSDEGKRNLSPSIQHWLNPRHKPRVRRTIDDDSHAIKAQIIKSRIADLDIYNPRCDFDYRISISIESPWDGESHWLTETTEGGRDRKKDRMSYRHLAYQIDLTQVSYLSTTKKEHELEVEISTEQIRIELANLQAQRPSRYEELVRGFLDNVRILCRKGTVSKPV